MASRSTGTDFARYRGAITASIDEVDLYALHAIVEQLAVPLINSFCQDGSADLIRQYVFPLVFEVVNYLLGCPRRSAGRSPPVRPPCSKVSTPRRATGCSGRR